MKRHGDYITHSSVTSLEVTSLNVTEKLVNDRTVLHLHARYTPLSYLLALLGNKWLLLLVHLKVFMKYAVFRIGSSLYFSAVLKQNALQRHME